MKLPKLKFYIYGYLDKLKNEWFYIGKGQGRRYQLYWHTHDCVNNKLLKNKIKKLTPKNIDIVFISQFKDEDLAYEMEDFYINKIGCRFDNTGPLCNLTKDRGTKKSEDSGFSGRNHSVTSNLKNALAHSGEKSYRAKLINEDVFTIRQIPLSVKSHEVAKVYDVGPSAIRKIRSYNRWRYII